MILLCNSAKTLANTYYVSSAGNGNDNHSGTIYSPFKTIGMAVSKLKAGDIAYVRAGTYVEWIIIEKSGTANLPISILAYPGETPVIDGEGRLPAGSWRALVQIMGDYVNISGFEVKNSNSSGDFDGGAGIVCSGQHDKVSKMNVHHAWENGILASGDYDIIEDCHVWQCVLVNIQGRADFWSSGVTAARSRVDGIATNCILRRNLVHDNWGEGLSTYEAEGTIIEDNIVYDNWTFNLYVSDTRNALVQRNIVYGTGVDAAPFVLADEQVNKPRSANNIIINNFIYNVNFWAFWSTDVAGSGLDNVLIANNTIVNGQLIIGNHEADGVINKSAFIKNNIFVNEHDDSWVISGTLNNLTFSNNLWDAKPPSGLSSNSDVIGDPELAKTGSTLAGELTADYFKLKATSPAIHKGTALSEVSQDFFGNLRNDIPDIGAHEYETSNQTILVSNIIVSGAGGSSAISLKGGHLQLTATVVPTNATHKTIAWSLQNGTGKASISPTGLVTAIANGSVKATATATDGSGVSGILNMTISNQETQTGLDNEMSNDTYVTVTASEININTNEDSPFRQFDLYNMLGSPIMHRLIRDKDGHFDITSLIPGVYILVLSGMGETRKIKIVKP